MKRSDVRITQEQTKSSSSIQIGVQNNYGVPVEQAVQMALDQFYKHYPQLQDEALSMVKKMVEERLEKVVPENIVSPKANIAVPALQGASLAEEVEIRELYAALLSGSMDSTVCKDVHPGFSEIIRQLTSDEAKILKYLSTHNTIPTIGIRYEHEKGGGINIVTKFSDIGYILQCKNPEDIEIYIDNLVRLGIVSFAGDLSNLTDKSLYEPLKKHFAITKYASDIMAKERGFDKYRITESFVQLTMYGIKFCKICT